MSKKDVDNYYNQITADYTEMIETLKEMEELASQNIVNPDKVEELKKAVEPLKINYQRISWIMFLLNQPNKKAKKQKYNNSLNKTMLKIDPNKEHTQEAVHNENCNVINTVKNNDILNGEDSTN